MRANAKSMKMAVEYNYELGNGNFDNVSNSKDKEAMQLAWAKENGRNIVANLAIVYRENPHLI